MKKLVYILFALIFVGCSKSEIDLLFDKMPDERMNVLLDSLKHQITSSENGWIVYNQALSRGNYGYYMEFDEMERVKMVSDINATTANEIRESVYSIRLFGSPVLSFETYNYISMLNDPSPSIMNGVRGDGLKADVEFEYVRSNQDSLIFKGRRYHTEFVMVKATASQRNTYIEAGYNNAIEKTKKFFVDNPISFIEINNEKFQLEINPLMKKSTISTVKDNKVHTSTNNFYFNLEGASIPNGISALGNKIIAFNWAGDLLQAVDSLGNKFPINNSPTQILPLDNIIGVKFSNFRSPFKTYFPGTSEKGLEILKRYQENLDNRTTGYVFNSGYLNLLWDITNRRVTLGGWHNQNGNTGWTTSIVYNYEYNESTKEYTLTLRTAASGGYVSSIMNLMNDFLLNNKIKLDYYVDGGITYAQVIGGSNDEVKMTFSLQ